MKYKFVFFKEVLVFLRGCEQTYCQPKHFCLCVTLIHYIMNSINLKRLEKCFQKKKDFFTENMKIFMTLRYYSILRLKAGPSRKEGSWINVTFTERWLSKTKFIQTHSGSSGTFAISNFPLFDHLTVMALKRKDVLQSIL